jgi:hypothetical protein
MLDVEIVECSNIQRATQIFFRDGFVALSHSLTDQQLAFAQAGADRVVAEQKLAIPYEEANRGYARYSFGQQIKHPEWKMLVDLPTTLPILNSIWKSNEYKCSGAGGDYSHPGAKIQHLHSDLGDLLNDPLKQVCIYDLPTPFIVINFLMTDFTENNGAIRFVPGTQRTRLRPPPIEEEPAHWKNSIVCAPAGTAILRDVRCWHGGTANKSTSPRIMTSAGYYAPWFNKIPEKSLDLTEYLGMTDRGKELCNTLVDLEKINSK